jgi:hypothetical protein
MEKPERPERDAPATDWSKMLQPLSAAKFLGRIDRKLPGSSTYLRSKSGL